MYELLAKNKARAIVFSLACLGFLAVVASPLVAFYFFLFALFVFALCFGEATA